MLKLDTTTFALVKDEKMMFAKTTSRDIYNLLDTDNGYKIFLVCKLELQDNNQYRLTVNFDKEYPEIYKDHLINRIHEYICNFKIFEFAYFIVGFDKPTRTFNYTTTQSLFHVDSFTPNADGNASEFVKLTSSIVPSKTTSDISILKYASQHDVCSVQAFIMNSTIKNDADSIRTRVCNGNIIFMRQKYNELELPHSIPFVTEYYPTTSPYTNSHNRLSYYSDLRSIGDRMLEEPTSLGERVIIRCQIINLTETQYATFLNYIQIQLVVSKALDESNITTVYDYDKYVKIINYGVCMK